MLTPEEYIVSIAPGNKVPEGISSIWESEDNLLSLWVLDSTYYLLSSNPSSKRRILNTYDANRLSGIELSTIIITKDLTFIEDPLFKKYMFVSKSWIDDLKMLDIIGSSDEPTTSLSSRQP